MAMDDTYFLVKALLIDGKMTKPDQHNEKGEPTHWVEATVLDASVFGSHSGGFYNGYARFMVDEKSYAEDATFQALMLDGWTTLECRDQIMLAQKLPKKAGTKKKK